MQISFVKYEISKWKRENRKRSVCYGIYWGPVYMFISDFQCRTNTQIMWNTFTKMSFSHKKIRATFSSFLFEYETPKVVTVRNVPLGILRLLGTRGLWVLMCPIRLSLYGLFTNESNLIWRNPDKFSGPPLFVEYT